MDVLLQEVLIKFVPLLGASLSLLLGLVPMRDVLRCRRNKSLGQVNPDVFPLLFFNAVGWTFYSSCTQNPYLFASVYINLMAGMFYTLNAYQLAESDAARRRIETVMLTMLGVWSTLGFASPQIPEQLRDNLVGFTATMVSLLLFSSPLSTMTTVIRVKSAASISLPFALIQLLCCSLWSLYGFAIHDVFLAAPNGLAATLGVLQLLLLAIFGSNAPSTSQALVIGLPLLPTPSPQESDSYHSDSYQLFVGQQLQTTFIAPGAECAPTDVSMPEEVVQVVSPLDEEIQGVDKV
ncbi:sugar efflux transporter for intercellular exchange-domain-containing protein [Baffinella frigidus]|nr:sugar efflux transporter for intercellular exchange-domain-containing protein [Cryptophyta sp. CCMP2293]